MSGLRATLCPAGAIELRATTGLFVLDVCQSLTVGEIGFASDRRRAARIMPESAALLPPGLEIDVVATSRADGLFVEFDEARARSISYEATDGRLGGGSISYTPDPAIGALTRQMLARLACDPSPTGSTFAEGLMIAMVARCLETAAGAQMPRHVDASFRQMRRAIDFIETRLGDPIRIQEIAGAVGMSPAAFQRAFKMSTGKTPHHFLQRRRSERAVELIRTTARPLSQIAHETGFSSQSHMGAKVKALLGVTPGELRAG